MPCNRLHILECRILVLFTLTGHFSLAILHCFIMLQQDNFSTYFQKIVSELLECQLTHIFPFSVYIILQSSFLVKVKQQGTFSFEGFHTVFSIIKKFYIQFTYYHFCILDQINNFNMCVSLSIIYFRSSVSIIWCSSSYGSYLFLMNNWINGSANPCK